MSNPKTLTIEQQKERDEIIAAAVRDGKILASSAYDVARGYDTAPDRYKTLLTGPVKAGGLAPGIAPAIAQVTGQAGAEPDAYPDGWLSPSERAVAAGGEHPASNRVQVEQ